MLEWAAASGKCHYVQLLCDNYYAMFILRRKSSLIEIYLYTFAVSFIKLFNKLIYETTQQIYAQKNTYFNKLHLERSWQITK